MQLPVWPLRCFAMPAKPLKTPHDDGSRTGGSEKPQLRATWWPTPWHNTLLLAAAHTAKMQRVEKRRKAETQQTVELAKAQMQAEFLTNQNEDPNKQNQDLKRALLGAQPSA